MSTLCFETDFHADKIDPTNGVIRGVSVITSGVTARGHDLAVDETTLKQMLLCAQHKEQVPVKVDHKSGAGAVCGFLTNFAIKDGKLKADWHLLASHPQRDQILEAADRMPRGIGLSAAFVAPEGEFFTGNGKKAARCEELISVDYVSLPAANPNGLFSANVDTQVSTRMSTNANTPAGEPSLSDLLAAIQSIQQQNAEFASRLDAMEQASELQENPPTLEQIAGMSDEELAELGITREEVDEAVAEALAAEDGEAPAEGSEGTEGAESAEAAAPAAAGAASGGSTGFAALQKQVTELSAQLKAMRQSDQRSREEILFGEIESKVQDLIAQRDAAVDALETGGKAVSPGVERHGVRFFSANKEQGTFENMVAQLMDNDPKMTKSQAFQFARKRDPQAFVEFQARKGIISLSE